jgi:type II secretory pathway pseudopilin PulG
MPVQRMRRSGGFTYLSLIILVAIIGLVAASALKLGSVLQRSRAEQELLDIGAAFSDALQSYADATPAGQPPQPPSLKELLKDPRYPGVRRHLRKLFVDPMTGKPEWGIVYLGDKIGVLAVYSLSDAKPVKIGNFPARFQGLEGKEKVSEWRFAATGKAGPNAPAGAPPVPGQPLAPGAPVPGAPGAPGTAPGMTAPGGSLFPFVPQPPAPGSTSAPVPASTPMPAPPPAPAQEPAPPSPVEPPAETPPPETNQPPAESAPPAEPPETK